MQASTHPGRDPHVRISSLHSDYDHSSLCRPNSYPQPLCIGYLCDDGGRPHVRGAVHDPHARNVWPWPQAACTRRPPEEEGHSFRQIDSCIAAAERWCQIPHHCHCDYSDLCAFLSSGTLTTLSRQYCAGLSILSSVGTCQQPWYHMGWVLDAPWFIFLVSLHAMHNAIIWLGWP